MSFQGTHYSALEQAHSLTLDQLKEVCRNATPSCVLLEGLSLEGVDKTELCPNAGLYIREVKPFHILSFSDCAVLQLFHTGVNIVLTIFLLIRLVKEWQNMVVLRSS